VEKVLGDLGLLEKQRILAFNKIDRLSREEAQNLSRRYGAVAVSALDPSTFDPLLRAVRQAAAREKLVESHV
jgi:GTP-binding protein HflX